MMHTETNTPIVGLELCEFDKERKCLKLASEYFGMPQRFAVKSHHTGRVMEFIPVSYGDPLFDEDGWDGEQQIYRPVEYLDNLEYMVIYNQW